MPVRKAIRTWALLASLLHCLVANPAAQSRTDDATTRIDTLIQEADRLASPQVRQGDRALALYRQAATLAEQTRDDNRAADAWLKLGRTLWQISRLDEARPALEKARALSHATGNTASEADASRTLANVFIDGGRFERGEEMMRGTLEIGRRIGDTQIVLASLNGLSVAARRQGRLEDAYEYARLGLQELDKAKASSGGTLASGLFFSLPFNVGKALADAGDFASASVYFDRADAAARRTNMLAGQWHILFDSAEWYQAQGDVDRAARFYERALELASGLDGPDMRAETLRGLASVAESRGDLPSASARYQEALAAYEQMGFGYELAKTLIALSRARFNLGQRTEAASLLDRAFKESAGAAQLDGLTLAHLERARQMTAANEPLPGIESAYRAALDTARRGGIHPLLSAALLGLARVAVARGDDRAALAHYEASADTIERIRARAASPTLRLSLADATYDTYAGLIALHVNRYRREPLAVHALGAFLAFERARAQTLVEPLLDDDVRRPSSAGGTARTAWREAASIQRELLDPALAVARRRTLLARLDDVERTLDSAGSITSRSSAREAPSNRSAASENPRQRLERLQTTMGAHEALIAYTDMPVAFVLTRDDLRIVDLPRLEAVDERVASFVRLLADGQGVHAVAAGRALSRALIEPIVATLPPAVTRLTIAAGGALAQVPFAALPLPASQAAVPLIARYEVSLTPSASTLASLRLPRPASPAGRVAAIGDPLLPQRPGPLTSTMRDAALQPLPHARAEVEAVARFSPERAEVLIGAAASEATLKRRAIAGTQIVHVATHALLDSRVPSRSAIVLAPGDDDEDGLLQLREIYGLDLDAELVVLSACRTAAGRASRAEGLESLARGFLFAGARSVVGTMWDVDDRLTAEAMERFYRAMAAGGTVGSALRQAQLDLAGDDPYSTAAQWAGLMVIGDASARVALKTPSVLAIAFPSPFLLPAMAVAGGIGLIIVGRTYRRRRFDRGAP